MASGEWQDQVVSAGFIVYRCYNGVVQYLLMKHTHAGHYTPPKGRLEPGESEMEAALRETEEESGFTKDDLNVIHTCQHTLRYTDRRKRQKRVEYWLAELKDPEKQVTMSNEHSHYDWMALEDALNCQRKYPVMQKVFRKVESLIKKDT